MQVLCMFKKQNCFKMKTKKKKIVGESGRYRFSLPLNMVKFKFLQRYYTNVRWQTSVAQLTPLSPTNHYITVVPALSSKGESYLWKLQLSFLNQFRCGFKALHVVKYNQSIISEAQAPLRARLLPQSIHSSSLCRKSYPNPGHSSHKASLSSSWGGKKKKQEKAGRGMWGSGHT